jgi:protein SCO1
LFKLLLIALTLTHVSAYLPDSGVGKQNEMPDAIEGVGIDEYLDTQIPGDLTFINEKGERIQVSDFFNDKKPVIFSLVYYSCPSLCNLHLKGVFEVFKELRLTPGEDFEFVAVTIDPKEDADLASAKKDTYVSEFLSQMDNPDRGIHFLTGTQENITQLAEKVGFKYKWNEDIQEWAHASAAIVTTPKGIISRYLHGVYFEPQTFRLSVVEASQGLIGNFADNFALFCFRYDPKTNKYSFYIMNILRGVAAIVLLLLLAWLVPFWLKAKKA